MKKVFLFILTVITISACSNKTLMYDDFNPVDYLKFDSVCNNDVLSKVLYSALYNKYSKDFEATYSSDEEYAINKKIKVLNNLYEVDSLLLYDNSMFKYYLMKKDKNTTQGLAGFADALDDLSQAISLAGSRYANIDEVFNEEYATYKNLVKNTICEARLIASDDDSKSFQLHYYNSYIDELVLIKFEFNDKKECVYYRFM